MHTNPPCRIAGLIEQMLRRATYEHPLNKLVNLLCGEGAHLSAQDIIAQLQDESPKLPSMVFEMDHSEIHCFVTPLPHYKKVSLLLLVREAIAHLNKLIKDSPAWEALFSGDADAFAQLSSHTQRALLIDEHTILQYGVTTLLLAGAKLSRTQAKELDQLIHGIKLKPNPGKPSSEFLGTIQKGKGGRCHTPSLNDAIREIYRELDVTIFEGALGLAAEVEYLLMETIPKELHSVTEPPSITMSAAEVADLIIKNAEATATTPAATQPDQPAEPDKK